MSSRTLPGLAYIVMAVYAFLTAASTAVMFGVLLFYAAVQGIVLLLVLAVAIEAGAQTAAGAVFLRRGRRLVRMHRTIEVPLPPLEPLDWEAVLFRTGFVLIGALLLLKGITGALNGVSNLLIVPQFRDVSRSHLSDTPAWLQVGTGIVKCGLGLYLLLGAPVIHRLLGRIRRRAPKVFPVAPARPLP